MTNHPNRARGRPRKLDDDGNPDAKVHFALRLPPALASAARADRARAEAALEREFTRAE